MTDLSLTVKNGELVRMGLQNLSAEIPKVGKGQIWNACQRVVVRMKKYWTENNPPELPSYQRTGRLAQGYTVTPKTTGYPGYTIGNPTDYTKYVVGNAYGLEQVWFHAYDSQTKAKRHTTLRDVAEEEAQKLPDDVLAELTMVARREGFT